MPIIMSAMHSPGRIMLFKHDLAATDFANGLINADKTTFCDHATAKKHVNDAIDKAERGGAKPDVVFLEYNLGHPGGSENTDIFDAAFFRSHADITFVLITGTPALRVEARNLLRNGVANIITDLVGQEAFTRGEFLAACRQAYDRHTHGPRNAGDLDGATDHADDGYPTDNRGDIGDMPGSNDTDDEGGAEINESDLAEHLAGSEPIATRLR